ncbi:Ger(x)C family spore germination protein [Sporomusa acidovorans]|uniref:Spore germination protein B3 n=1 Tax=Sporomusa acidovorans (strain ATCC 49682 / DSM 3132 / Mol) TaxID=1123286 RepID=A0ABZ3IVK0_SPOA4|nr:Ger(x)C family spore germination protein [Sporomusa acidovorans]OZC15258.1 spore germination protein B3 precursor [Sporomusa acidovorans DSM 3132]SDE91430.1 spore germination protein KC [Sporomusa acidovorans]
MMLRTRILSITLILLFVLPLTGCWNRRELNTLAIVGIVGVDLDKNGIKSTFEIIKPEKPGKGGEKGEAPVKYIQTNGKTLMDTYRSAPLRFDRRMFYSHTKAFLFSEEIAQNGLATHLDQILRDHEMRLTMHLVIVKDDSVSDIMGIASGVNTIPSNYLEDLIKQYKIHSKSVDSKIIDFLKAYLDKGKNPVVTVLRKVRKNKTGSKDEEYELTPEGSAVFLKDRLVGFLDGQETRGYNLVIGKVVSGIVTFPIPNSNGNASIEILKADSKNDVEITDNDIKIKVKINMVGMLDEQTTSLQDKDMIEIVAILEQAAAEAINKEVEHTLLKVQTEYHSDIFGFGQIVHRKYPHEWKIIQDNWDELFSHAAIEVESQTKITKTGKSTFPAKE